MSLGKHPRRESSASNYDETGTLVSSYEECGPYHCGDCSWLRNKTLCVHPVVVDDFELRSKRHGATVTIDPERGCCKFVRMSS